MSWIAEVRYAFRAMSRSRGFTAVAALTLALSIGANTAIFSLADAIVNRPFAFPHLDRMVELTATLPKSGVERYAVTPADYFDWAEQNRVFSQLAAYAPWSARLTGAGEPRDVRAYRVSPEFFAVAGIAALRGRAFDAHAQQEPEGVVVSYGFWQQHLASDAAITGKQINLNGLGYTVLGVMPKQFDFPTYAEIWVPWIPTPGEARAERTTGELTVIGRLKPGVSVAQSQTEMTRIADELARKYPATNRGRGVRVMRLADSADPYAIRYMNVIRVAVAFLLILACANVANLQLARCATRQREMALRAALGASHSRLVLQLLAEGAILSLAGAALGWPLASEALALIRNSVPGLVARHLPGLPYAVIDARVLAWMVVAAVLTAVAFTLPAALQVRPGRLQELVGQGGRGTTGRGGRRMRSALVVSELGFALILLTGAALLFQSFRHLSPANEGFHPGQVLTFVESAPDYQGSPQQIANFFQERLRRLAGLPEVGAATLISELPALSDSRSSSVLVEGRPAPPPETPLLAEMRIVGPGYFSMLEIPILSGRAVEQGDGPDGLPVAVISKATARRFFPQGDPIGQRLQLQIGRSHTAWMTVAGVAGDVNHFFLDSEIRPTVYVPYLQYPVRDLHVLVQPAASVLRTAAAVRSAMKALDPAQPSFDLQSIGRFYADLSGGVGVIATLIGVFAGLSLVLSAGGLYAVMHFSVAQRTQEIGIRMALGARAADVWSAVLGDALRLIGAAFALAAPVAVMLGRTMAELLAGIVALDPLVIGGAAAVLGGTALLAAFLPARRAMAVDPIIVIRRL